MGTTTTVITIYIIVAVALALVNVQIARLSFRRSGEIGRFLGYSALLAAVINITYLCSALIHTYIYVSIFSSIYFICIDWFLIALVHFVILYTNTTRQKYYTGIRTIIRLLSILDNAVLMMNIFIEVAVHYVERDTAVAYYSYEIKPPYTAHLIFTYFLIFIILYILLKKIADTPRHYRTQYTLIVISILFVVAINAVFLFVDGNSPIAILDLSILGYSIGLYLLYWSSFDYRSKQMLESLSLTIFSNMDQGIVLFDFERNYIMHNKMAEAMVPQAKYRDRMPIQEFLTACDLPDKEAEIYTLQRNALKINYRKMRDENNILLGELFIFSNIENDTDQLTGFVHWEKFREFAMENPWDFAPPTSVIMLDILGLDLINRTFGREVGDQRIHNLVKLMQQKLPPETYFVRGYEAHLIGICPAVSEQELHVTANEISAACRGTVKYGLSSIGHDVNVAEMDIIQAVETASRSLQVKKLLDHHSAHSQTLTSLVKALQESDSDTEAHVRRTQKMGELLGHRIGLNDAEISDLKLLCLLHDIGKIGIPLEILNKPGKLTDTEWDMLRSHVEKGYQIAMSSNELQPIAPYILYHHERWDGKGYPKGLTGTEIPVLSRIISIVDAYDAMVNSRSYRKNMMPEEAQQELKRCEGTQFDPFLTNEFLHMLEEYPELAIGENTAQNDPSVPHDDGDPTFEAPLSSTVPVPYCRYLLDVDDFIVEVDNTFESITGYSRYDVIENHMRQIDLIPQEEQTSYIVHVNHQFTKANMVFLEHNIQKKDGTLQRIFCLGKRYFDSSVKSYRSEVVIIKTLDPSVTDEPSEALTILD